MFSFRVLVLLTVFPVFLLLLGCTPDRLQDTAPLEHQLLVAWVALERGDPDVLREYTAAAARSYQRLRSSYSSAELSLAERQGVRLMNLWMQGLQHAVANGEPYRARRQLRQLRDQLSVLRPAYGVDDPADLLYAFDRQWEWVEEISHDQMMCLLEWDEYRDAYRTAYRSWRRFQQLPPVYAERTLPGRMRNSNAAEYAGLQLSRSLDAFDAALHEADHRYMAAASEEVRDHFIQYLSVAVDYPVATVSL
ncbi:hypothetical protein LEM8419_01842 [Neolewinella maritima]|uniref:Uncharacterized protein n=1 Tax=Neolewinella maritima TaxID=1383882 RepID=A0ABN8F6U7_9BACT|nr:hypothetical protein [Neolewinella maritima]CAH1000708.1 hypothetical protein LEM8419_01842 [Neolewinella maritima]